MMFLSFLGSLREIMATFFYKLCELLAGVYNIFMVISKINIFSQDQSIITDIYKRMQAILAVVMTFYLIFQFIKYILQPETAADQQKGIGGSIKRIIIVVLLMAFTPTLFNFAYSLKDRVLDTQIIEKVIGYKSEDGKDTKDLDDVINMSCAGTKGGKTNNGGLFAANAFGMFVKPNKIFCTVGSDGRLSNCKSFEKTETAPNRILYLKRKLAGCEGQLAHPDWGFGHEDNPKGYDGEEWYFEFNWYLGIPVVIFMIWIFINYCIEAGRMVFQFALLQLIAPVPIMSYLSSNKDNMFNKWFKQCTTTYIDVFLRLAIISFVLLLSQLLMKIDLTVFESIEGGSSTEFFVKVFLIVGLLLFAMKAPALIKELLPNIAGGAAGGGFGLSKKAFKDRMNPSARLAGALAGATRGPAKNLARLARAAGRGAKKVWRGGRKAIGIGDGSLFRGAGKMLGHAVSRRFNAGLDKGRDAVENLRQRRREANEQLKKDIENEKNAIDNYKNRPRETKAQRAERIEKQRRAAAALKDAMNEQNSAMNSYNAAVSEYNALLTKRKNGETVSEDRLDKLNNDINTAKTKVGEANKKLIDAKVNAENEGISTTSKDVGDMAREIDTASAELKTLREKHDKLSSKGETLNSKERDELDRLEAEVRTKEGILSEKKKSLSNAVKEKEGAKLNSLFDAQDEFSEANRELEEANRELTAAGEDDGKKAAANEKIKAATKKRDDAKNKLDSAEKEFAVSSVDAAKDSAIELKNKAAKDEKIRLLNEVENARKNTDETLDILGKNNKFKLAAAELADSKVGSIVRGVKNFVAPAVSTVGGIGLHVVGDTVKGAYQGSKITDIGKVIPETLKGMKADVNDLVKREEYIAEGGKTGAVAWVKNKVSHVASDYLGLPNEQQAINAENKTLDILSKREESSLKAQQAVPENYDKSVTAAKEVLGKGKMNKVNLSSILSGRTFSDGSDIGDTRDVGALFNMVLNKATTLKARSETFTKSAADIELELTKNGRKEEMDALRKELPTSFADPNYSSKIAALKAGPKYASDKDIIDFFELEKRAYDVQEEQRVAESQQNELSKMISEAAIVSTLGGANIDTDINVAVSNFFTNLQTLCSDRRAAEAVIAELEKKRGEPGFDFARSLLLKSNISRSDLVGITTSSLKCINEAIAASKVISSNQLANFSERRRQNQERHDTIQRDQKYYNESDSSSGGGKK